MKDCLTTQSTIRHASYESHGEASGHGGGVATGHTPTPSHFPANFRAGGGGGGGGAGSGGGGGSGAG